MNDECTPRWARLMLWSIVISVGYWIALSVRPEWARLTGPDWYFLLGFTTALRCKGKEIAPLIWCGAMHDLFAGGRLGCFLILYWIAAEIMTQWRARGGMPRNETGEALSAAVFCCMIAIPRGILIWASSVPIPDLIANGLWTALWTGMFYPVALWILDRPRRRPWRISESSRARLTRRII